MMFVPQVNDKGTKITKPGAAARVTLGNLLQTMISRMIIGFFPLQPVIPNLSFTLKLNKHKVQTLKMFSGHICNTNSAS
jgi:hypothetical protein